MPDRPRWSRYRYPESAIRFGIWFSLLALVVWSVHFLGVDLERLVGAFPRLARNLATRYFPPELGYVSQSEFLVSVLRTLQMSLVGGFFGVLISVPLAWFASRNVTLSRRFAYPFGRFAIMGCRAIHETIWTMLFVIVLGYGMFAGIVALTMFCIGFAGKLFSDEFEAIAMGPVEALRAVGAGPVQILQHAVLPQVRVAFVGIGLYTWDVAFRAATVVGFFGGGGMGWHLQQAVQQIETRRAAAILLVIIAIVALAELGSGWMRSVVRRMR